MKLADKLQRIQAATPYHDVTGFMYAKKEAIKRPYKKITLFTLFVSDENTHLIRPHVFQTERARTPKQWAEWMRQNLTYIYTTAVLPTLALRTNKQWAVQRIIGFTGGAKRSPATAAMGNTRHKAKRQGRKNGQIHLRRRHRNNRR